jgi:hypothetical protein
MIRTLPTLRCPAGALASLLLLLAPGIAFSAEGEEPAEREAGPERIQAKPLDEATAVRRQGNVEGVDSQKRIDEISDETETLFARYSNALRQIDSLRVYNSQLGELIASQEAELASLRDQLDRVEVVGRSVTPLMHRMIDALEALVRLDLPFLLDERSERVASLRELMNRSDVTSAEKYRRIMEAYQIENEYGRTIEAYRSSLERGGQEIKVDFLRFGRIALLYQTLDGKESGVWDQRAKGWVALDPSYRTSIRQGLRIARKQAAPDLIRLALPAAEGGEG